MRKKLLNVVAPVLGAILVTASATACGTAPTAPVNGGSTTAATTVADATTAAGDQQTDAPTTVADEVKDYGSLAVSFPTGNIRVTINILALQKGYFAEEGVEVTPVAIGGNDALTAINENNGTLDILTAGFVGDVQAIGSGYDLKFIAGTAVEGGAVVAKKGNADQYKSDSTIIDVNAVASAKLGFVRNEASWIITRQYLLDNGISDDAIKAIEAEDTGSISYLGDATETALAVQKGQIDLGFLPREYALLYADSYDLEIVAAAGDLSPDYVCCREVTSAAALTEKYDAYVAYETARIRAFEYYKLGETDATVKDEVVSIVAEYSGKEKDYVETYLYGGITKFAVDPNTAGIEHYIEAANNSGVFSKSATDFSTYDITQNIDTSAYKEALDNLVAQNPDNAFYASLLEEYNNAN